MIKKMFLACFISTLFLLSACYSGSDKNEFPQAILSKPAGISILTDDAERILVPSDLEFDEIYKAIEKNWWKTIRNAEQPPEDYNLKDMESPIKILNKLWPDSLSDSDSIITFQYDQPITWKNAINVEYEGEELYITTYAFVIPADNAVENVKGFLLISEDEDIYNKSNMYVYYYNRDLFDLLKK